MIFVCETLRFLRVSPRHNTNSTESSPKAVELRSRCSSLVIVSKKLKSWIEVLETSKWVIELLLVKEKTSVSALNVAPDKTSFFKEANTELCVLDMETTAHLFMSKHSRCGMFGAFLTLVHERLRKHKFGNLRILTAPWLVTLLPQMSRYSSFVST